MRKTIVEEKVQKPKKYQPRFTPKEIQQLIDWHSGYFCGCKKLYDKLLRIHRKMAK